MLTDQYQKETTGAWIVHHGQKISLDVNAAAEFPAIDEAAKAANLLARLGESDETTLTNGIVKAVAQSAGLNPRYELEGLLGTLQRKRLIDRSANEVVVLGVTTRSALAQATELFEEASPTDAERASIQLGEIASKAPIDATKATEYIADSFRMTSAIASEFINQSEQIGFVDAEGKDADKLLFNGHLFRRDNIAKSSKVLNSLSSHEQEKVTEFDTLLKSNGCLPVSEAEKILGDALLKKLFSASLYDTHTVSNDQGENVYITSPASFHKFVDPLIDDTFDMAKALVAALYYGMTRSSYTRGKITMIDALLSKLISGQSVGPATAIGQDYRVLEERRVVQIRRSSNRFFMRLLKREVGEIALQVLRSGDANASSVVNLPTAPMAKYVGPENTRVRIRKTQSGISKRQTLDVLSALRSGNTL